MYSRENTTLTAAVSDALDLGTLTDRDKLLMQRKISNHGLGLCSMESNLEFLFLAGFMKTVRSIRHAFPNFQATLECTLDADSSDYYGLELADGCFGAPTAVVKPEAQCPLAEYTP